MVTVGWDGLFFYWDTDNSSIIFTEENSGTRFHIACMSHDERYAFAGDYNSIVHIFDLWEKKRIHTFNPQIGSMPYDMCCSPDNRYLVIAGNSPRVALYDIQEKKVEKYLTGHKQGAVPWVAVTRDMKFVLTASYTETIIWNAATW